MVILVDDEDRENEGDLTMAAEKVTPEAINFMAKHGRGLICLTLTEEKADALELPLQSARKGGGSRRSAPRSPSRIEARQRRHHRHQRQGSRAPPSCTAVARGARPEDLITPGHVFPLRAKRGGVLVRTGQTEGSVDLARLAGLTPAGVICEIMNDDGSMARMPDLEKFAAQHGLRILSIADLIEYRLQQESLVERAATAPLTPTLPGVTARVHGARLRHAVEKTEYLALTLGDVGARRAGAGARADRLLPRRRVRLGGVRLRRAAARGAAGDRARGARRVALRVSRRGGTRCSATSRRTCCTRRRARVAGREHKLRDFGLGAQVLAHARRASDLRLLTNNPKKIVGLEGYGMCVVERVPLEMPATPAQHDAPARQARSRRAPVSAVERRPARRPK